MREIKALFLVLLCSLIVNSLYYPSFAQDEIIVDDKKPVELIQLDASYDTNYKVDADKSSKPDSAIQPSLDTISSPQSLLNTISLRKIIPVLFESSLNSQSVCIGDQ